MPIECPSCGESNIRGSDSCQNCLTDLTQHDQPTPRNRVEVTLMNDRVSLLLQRDLVTVKPESL